MSVSEFHEETDFTAVNSFKEKRGQELQEKELEKITRERDEVRQQVEKLKTKLYGFDEATISEKVCISGTMNAALIWDPRKSASRRKKRSVKKNFKSL